MWSSCQQTAPGSSLGVNTYLGQSIGFYNPQPSTPYTVRFNLNVQRQLSKNTVMEVGWLMNHSVHLGIDRPLNYTPAAYLSTTGVRDQATIDFLSTQVANPFAGLIYPLTYANSLGGPPVRGMRLGSQLRLSRSMTRRIEPRC